MSKETEEVDADSDGRRKLSMEHGRSVDTIYSLLLWQLYFRNRKSFSC